MVNEMSEETRPDPTPVLVAHSENLSGLTDALIAVNDRLTSLEIRSARLPAAVVAIVGKGFSQVADELGLDNRARARLQEELEAAGRNVNSLIDL